MVDELWNAMLERLVDCGLDVCQRLTSSHLCRAVADVHKQPRPRPPARKPDRVLGSGGGKLEAGGLRMRKTTRTVTQNTLLSRDSIAGNDSQIHIVMLRYPCSPSCALDRQIQSKSFLRIMINVHKNRAIHHDQDV
jgi:hypothetical protein